jgi:hypothetical protein
VLLVNKHLTAQRGIILNIRANALFPKSLLGTSTDLAYTTLGILRMPFALRFG